MSFFISVIIFISINIPYTKIRSVYLNIQNKQENNVKMETVNVTNNLENGENKKSKVKPKEYKKTDEKTKNSNAKENIWQIEIPKIDLIAPIAEGTTQEVMDKYVGHFENTEKWSGNIGLAAHNRRIPS